jgi:hypothetical protein
MASVGVIPSLSRTAFAFPFEVRFPRAAWIISILLIGVSFRLGVPQTPAAGGKQVE